MSPLKRSNNIAARMGRWSATTGRQPSSAGSRSSSPPSSSAARSAPSTSSRTTSPSARPPPPELSKIIEAGFPQSPDEQGEIVLIQSKTLTADDPAFKAAIDDVVKTLDTYPKVRKLGLAARRGPPRPDLGQVPPRGDGPVQPEGRLRPDNTGTSTRSSPASTRPLSAIRPSTSRSSAVPAPARPSTRRSRACSRPPA